MKSPNLLPISIPARYPCATIFVDESAAKESGGKFFVVGAIKTRKPGMLLREIRALRDAHGHQDELKFSRISRGKLPIYHQLIDILEASDVHLAACVVDSSVGVDPFKSKEPDWLVHARITSKLIAGIVNRRELTAALLDERSTPAGHAFDDVVRSMVNTRLKALNLVSAVCVDSCSNDGVQVADLVAGAVAHQRRANANSNSHKAKVAARLATVFGLPDLSDVRTDRINIMTHGSVVGAVRSARTASVTRMFPAS